MLTIRTYLIRRKIFEEIRRNPQEENKKIVTLSKKIDSLSKGTVSMLELLTSMSYGFRLPDDDEAGDRLTSINFYNDLKRYSRLILGKIEEQNTKTAVDFRNKKITIEHIMPQIIENSDSWKVELGEHF